VPSLKTTHGSAPSLMMVRKGGAARAEAGIQRAQQAKARRALRPPVCSTRHGMAHRPLGPASSLASRLNDLSSSVLNYALWVRVKGEHSSESTVGDSKNAFDKVDFG